MENFGKIIILMIPFVMILQITFDNTQTGDVPMNLEKLFLSVVVCGFLYAYFNLLSLIYPLRS